MSYPVCRLASNLQQEMQRLSDALKSYHLAGKYFLGCTFFEKYKYTFMNFYVVGA